VPLKVTVTVLPLAVTLFTVATFAWYGSSALVMARSMEKATSAPAGPAKSRTVQAQGP
jgi:hypothetical protein